MNVILRTAQRFCEYGFSVFPCRMKKPIIPSWVEYNHTIPSDEKLTEWFSSEDVQIALVMGTKLVALDADTAKAKEHLLQIALPEQSKNYTPKGMHLLFRANPDMPVKNYAAPQLWAELDDERKRKTNQQDYERQNPEHLKIDARGFGGYIIIGPSAGYRLEVPNRDFLASIPMIEEHHLKHAGILRTKVEEKREERRDLFSVLNSISSLCSKVIWKSNAKFVSCCPAHDDRNPSFFAEICSYNGENRITLHCSSGCSFESIVSKLGMQPYMLFENPIARIKEAYTKQSVVSISPEVLQQKSKEILNSDLPEDLSLDGLPLLMQSYISEVQKRTDATTAVLVMSLLCQMSAYAKGKVVMTEYFQDLHPNLWTICISKSGSFKSTGLERGCATLISEDAEIQKRISRLYRDIEEMGTLGKSFQSQLTAEKEKLLEVKKMALRIPSTASWQGFLDHMQETGGGALILSEFAGWLDQFKQKHMEGVKPRLTEAYDVIYPLSERTRTNKLIHVENPYITIAGVTTAEFLTQSMPKGMDLDVKSGFFSRFLFFYPPSNDAIPPAFPKNELPFTETEVFRIMDELCKYIRSLDVQIFPTSRISKNGKELYESEYNRLYSDVSNLPDATKEMLAGFLKRWPVSVFKISMLLQCMECIEGNSISEDSIAGAWKIIRYCFESTKRFFTRDGLSVTQEKSERMLKYIAKHGGNVLYRTVLQSKMFGGGHLDYDYVLEFLSKSGKIVLSGNGNDKKITLV